MSKNIIVTTGDLKQDYEVIGPVYFQASNKGLFSNQLDKLSRQYADDIARMKKQGQMGQFQADWGFLYGGYSVGQTQFEKAFFVAVQELKKRGEMLGADAIISMRQDIDLDTNGFQFFYLQMYGTAVRFK
ncbi:MAG: heavy metal-binding domain-containing protein [Anaerolineae bacterium]